MCIGSEKGGKGSLNFEFLFISLGSTSKRLENCMTIPDFCELDQGILLWYFRTPFCSKMIQTFTWRQSQMSPAELGFANMHSFSAPLHPRNPIHCCTTIIWHWAISRGGLYVRTQKTIIIIILACALHKRPCCYFFSNLILFKPSLISIDPYWIWLQGILTAHQ